MLSIKTKAATAGSTCKFTGQVEWKIYRKPCCFSSNRSFLAKFPVNQLWESRHVLFFIIWSSYFISPRYEQQNSKGVLQRSNLCICFISACRSQLGPWIKILGPADWDDPQGPWRLDPSNVPGLHPSSSGTGPQPLWGHLICGTSQRSGAPSGGPWMVGLASVGVAEWG